MKSGLLVSPSQWSHVFSQLRTWPLALLLASVLHAQDLSLSNEVATYPSLTSSTVILSGNAELRVTGAAPLTGCQIHLNSPDAWLILTQIPPTTAISTYLSQVYVDGQPAVVDQNVRVIQHAVGAAIVAHSPSYQPLEIFRGPGFTGASAKLDLHTYYRDANLDSFHNDISSFKLKRGYMATFAQESNGTGVSKVFIAQDGDLEVNVMPIGLDDSVSFVRVFPWASVGKKGWSGGIPEGGGVAQLDLDWHYDWDNAVVSSRDTEYIPMRHNRNWNSWENINNKIGSTHVLGFNEPDRPDQADMSVEEAIALWPNLLASGLRLGSPAPASANWTSNEDWLGQFIERADALNYRVDFVAVHFYQANYTAQSLYDYLRAIHIRTRRPIWITEMNNGANWTDNVQPNLTVAQNSSVLNAFVQIMDSAPFVERYAIYNWVGDNRSLVLRDTATGLDHLTVTGEMYRDHQAPVAFIAENPPPDDTRFEAYYPFDGDLQDRSGNGSHPYVTGTPALVPGPSGQGQALQFDGEHDFVRLPAKIGGGVEFTFAAWVRWDGGPGFQRIFDFGNDTYRYMFLTPSSSAGTLRFSISENSYQNQTYIQTDGLTPGTWTHVAVTLKGNTGKLFVNGVMATEHTSITLNPINLSAWCNYLGKSQFPADPLFAGALDDVIISHTAYTDAQIASMVTNTPPAFDRQEFSVPDGIAGRYYRTSVAGTVTDDQPATLRFTKAGGPAWVQVAPDGTLYGMPSLSDAGNRHVAVAVTDESGASDLASVSLTIHPGRPETAPVGPVAHYRFENSTRSSIGLLHGTATGGPVYLDGSIGSGIALDGADDFITLPSGIASAPGLTVASWVRWDGGGSFQRIFDFGNGTGQYFFLTPSSGANTLRFAIKPNSATPETILQSSAALPIGVWTYVAVTLDGAMGTLWVNGAAVDTQPVAISPGSLNPAFNYLGKSQFSADPLFDGALDEVHIFDRALTGEELAELQQGDFHAPAFTSSPLTGGNAAAGVAYSGDLSAQVTDSDEGETFTFAKISGPPWLTISADGLLSGTPGSVDAGPNRFTVRVVDSTGRSDEALLDLTVTGGGTGASSAWAFEGNLLDHAGSAHGTATGNPAYLPGRRGQAISFNGSTDAVVLPAGITHTADITIATWVKWHGGSSWQRIFDFGSNTDRYLFLTPRSQANTLRFAIKASAAAAEERLEVATPPIGQWFHVAVTLEGNTGRLYLDGREVYSGAILTDPSAIAGGSNYLGDSQFAADPAFAGILDEFQIHSRALSASEIATLYKGDAGSAAETYAEWAQRQAGGNLVPSEDGDGDGVSNFAEYLLGLDPLNPNSRFFSAWESGTLSWPASPGIAFRVLRSATLAPNSWEEVDRISSSANPATWTDPDPLPGRGFYRIEFAE